MQTRQTSPAPTVVGYADKTLDQVEYVGVAFPKVGGSESLTYADFKPNCDETGLVGDGWQALYDGIIELDEVGNFERKLVYLPGYMATELGGQFGRELQPGWYDENEAIEDPDSGFLHCLNTEPVTFGHAFQINAPSGSALGAKVTWAGEVKNGPTFTDVDRVMGVANCAPKKLYLKDFIVNCDETGLVGDGWQALYDGIIELDEVGNFERKLVYLPGYMATELSGQFGREIQPGWYDENEAVEDPDSGFLNCLNESEDHAIPAGGGVQVNAPSGAALGATVTIKSALAE